MGVRGVPDLLKDADKPKMNIFSFTGKVLHVDFMGTYFAYFRALYFVFLCKEAVRSASESAIARTLNQRAGDIVDFINISPQGKLTDTFMLFSETALVDLLWTHTPGGSLNAKRISKVRKAAEKICTRSQAQGLAKDYGALIDALFFGIQGKPSQSSYFKRRISQSTLMQESWPGTGSQAADSSSQSSSSAALVVSGSSTQASSSAAAMPNVFAEDNLKAMMQSNQSVNDIQNKYFGTSGNLKIM